MAPRTIGALALRPTGNEQGGWFYLSLSTGRKINRLHATELPMPNLVVDRIHQMARRNKSGLEFHFIEQGGNFSDNSMKSATDSANYFKSHLQKYL